MYMWVIYKHTNLVNGKYYIGQTKRDLMTRWIETVKHANYEGTLYRNALFYRAIRKYGPSNWKHETIESGIETLEDANDREAFWIALFCSNNKRFGYNSTSGGRQGAMTLEVKNRLSESHLGKEHALSTKEKISEMSRKTVENYVGESFHWNSKLTTAQVANIRLLLSEKQMRQKDIAQMFNVSDTTISHIKHGKKKFYL